MYVSKATWDSLDKELVSSVGSKLTCSMKCAAKGRCGAALYHPSTGICELAEVSAHLKIGILKLS